MKKKDIKKIQDKLTSNKLDYCRKCGVPLLQSNRTADNDIDHNFYLRMELGVCLKCFNKGPDNQDKSHIRKM